MNTKEPINYQPQGTVPMMVGGNKNALNRQFGPDGKREWSHGLCDCCSALGTWCCSCWCPCVVYGKNKQRFRSLQGRGVPVQDGGDACSGDCFMYCCLASVTGCGWILQMGSRSDVRGRYSIRGGAFRDCCASFWCSSCVLTQERREIELEERSF
ncbi:PLAC8 family-domain-containing protein [Gloeopeniophorella convolvens]|nr:PLAC8 family-domain-containing protein [Gloeopeniophorella convolvens]